MKYANQAPKEFKAMSAGFKKKYSSVDQLPADRWKVQPKFDGVFAVINTGTTDYPGGTAYTRTGEVMHSIPHIVAKLRELVGCNQVVFGEVWHHAMTHQQINGASRRHDPQPELRFVCFDMVDPLEYSRGFAPAPYGWRLGCLNHAIDKEQVNLGEYRMLVKVTTLHQDWVNHHLGCDTIQDFANALVDNTLGGHYTGAYDGCMIVCMNSPWTAGAVKEGQAIKVKKVVSLDLLVVGQFAERKPTKIGGYLTVEYKGVRSDVGSGLNQDTLTNILWKQNTSLCGVDYTGMIAEVECLGLTPDGKLREPRFKGFRHDTVRQEDKE